MNAAITAEKLPDASALFRYLSEHNEAQPLASAAIDHMISITIFLAALLLFINLFSQTNQTAIIYERHRAVATKCSDLLDNMLLNPGSPQVIGAQQLWQCYRFWLQDPEFTQYQA